MIKNKFDIAILLSTYNGNNYVVELIDSILSQSEKNFCIFVRDDGSTDNTIEIIKNYSSKDNRVVYINDSLHLGPTQTFLYLLNEVESRYYMFCDQDDVWLPNKIELSLRKLVELERINKNKPVIVYTDLIVTDGNLNVIANSMWQYSHLNVDLPTSFNYVCVYNHISGCTMMFNHLVKELVKYPTIKLPKKLYHDWWVAICASRANGIIFPIKEQTILFRRHGDNETSVNTADTSLIAKISRIRDSFVKVVAKHRFFKSIGYGSLTKYLFYKSLISIKSIKK